MELTVSVLPRCFLHKSCNTWRLVMAVMWLFHILDFDHISTSY